LQVSATPTKKKRGDKEVRLSFPRAVKGVLFNHMPEKRMKAKGAIIFKGTADAT